MTKNRADQSSDRKPPAESLPEEQPHREAPRLRHQADASPPTGGDERSAHGYGLPRSREHGVEDALAELGAMEEENSATSEQEDRGETA